MENNLVDEVQGFHLFSKLYDLNHPSEEEYDRLFERIWACYQDFLFSDYNDSDRPLYECISDYVEDLVQAPVEGKEFGATVLVINKEWIDRPVKVKVIYI
jgi:hypothetical protein